MGGGGGGGGGGESNDIIIFSFCNLERDKNVGFTIAAALFIQNTLYYTRDSFIFCLCNFE